jgi:hypothetical protein
MSIIVIEAANAALARAFMGGINYVNDSSVEVTDLGNCKLLLDDEDMAGEAETFTLNLDGELLFKSTGVEL